MAGMEIETYGTEKERMAGMEIETYGTERERMAGMEIKTYGTECSEEFDYDDEVDYEEDGELTEKIARLEKENEEMKEELKKMAEKKEKLLEKLGERTETIARLTEEVARNNAQIALLSDLGYYPEGIPRIDDEELARLKDDTARKRSELGFLPRYDPPEKEEMFMRAMKDCILRKRQEIKAKQSGEMPADAPGLNMRRQMAMFLV